MTEVNETCLRNSGTSAGRSLLNLPHGCRLFCTSPTTARNRGWLPLVGTPRGDWTTLVRQITKPDYWVIPTVRIASAESSQCHRSSWLHQSMHSPSPGDGAKPYHRAEGMAVDGGGSPYLPATMPSGEPWPRSASLHRLTTKAASLRETIRSVLLQGYPNLGMVIDGSSDRTISHLHGTNNVGCPYWASSESATGAEAAHQQRDWCESRTVQLLHF